MPPSIPRGVNQYPKLFIPPNVRPTTPTRQQRGRSRKPRGTESDSDMQPQQEEQLEQIKMSTPKSRSRIAQPVQIIDVHPHQFPEIEQMTRSRSRRFNSKVLQAPGTAPVSANQQGPRPFFIPPEDPDQPRRTADTTWDYNNLFRNRQGTEPPVPPPSNGQEPNQKSKAEVIKTVKQTTGRSKTSVINATDQDNWTSEWGNCNWS